MAKSFLGLCLLMVAAAPQTAAAASPAIDTRRGDAMIAEYFRNETARLRDACLADVRSLEDWKSWREAYRRQLLEMLGLDPLPPKTDLHPVITGTTQHEEFVVENLHFQSRPGLYVTGNLYVPKKLSGPVPAILYVCGHGAVKKDGVSYGNKVSYQHHGSWFARHGYVCLTIDTLQLGEIEGIHHGTYRYGMWWWLNHGYTPAGVEAWNCVRALDYLETRQEVDPKRMGVTGRSGGGAYSWWIAAIDERIQVAVPVAGITDLENHVVGGCVEGHCDCMYFVNTYCWDYPLLAAMVAPRPLLISNTDSDGIFPLDGVVRTFEKTRQIYALYKAADKVGLTITAGPHKDTQELQVPAFRWFNHHLKKDDSLIAKPAEKFFEPEALRVFHELPKDQKNTQIQETFVALASPPTVPSSTVQWQELRTKWQRDLKEKAFAAWPQSPEPLNIQPAFSAQKQGVQLEAIDFTSQGPFRFRLYLVQQAGLPRAEQVRLIVADDDMWRTFLAAMRSAFESELGEETLPEADAKAWKTQYQALETGNVVFAYLAPRGVGPTAWDQSERKQIQHRRRFYLLGQTLDGMRVWDVRRALQALRTLERWPRNVQWSMESRQAMAGVVLYATLYEPGISQLQLHGLPRSHRDGPILLNVRRILDLPKTVAMAAERTQVILDQCEASDWEYPRSVVQQLGWDNNQLIISPSPDAPTPRPVTRSQ